MKKLITLLMLLCPLLGNTQQWVIDLDEYTYSVTWSGIVSNNGDIIAVGQCGVSDTSYCPMLMQSSNDGDYTIHVYDNSQFNFADQKLVFGEIIQLENNNYMVAASVIDNKSQNILKFGIIVFDPDFTMTSSRFYESDSVAESISIGELLLDDDGTTVMCGNYKYIKIHSNGIEQTIRRPFFYRFDELGDSLSCRYVKPVQSSDPEYYMESFECFQIMKNPCEDGYIVLGNGSGGIASVIFYDNEFNFKREFYPKYNNGSSLFDRIYTDTWMSDDRMLAYGHTLGEHWELMLADLNLDGTVNSYKNIHHIADTSINATTVAMVNDTTIYGGFYKYEAFKGFNISGGVCLFNTDMEVLGTITLASSYLNCSAHKVLPTNDGGCMLITFRDPYPGFENAVIIKFSREDFNPIPCSVKDIPHDKLHAVAFPNPTRGELNIDISGIPENTENRVSITDMQGMVRMSRIIRGNGNLLTIDASSLEAGTYVYSVFNSEKELLKGKFVKE